jgi:endonuclease VIII
MLDVVPEGDSIHRIALRLGPLVGERVAATSPHPQGRATGVAAAVDGLVLESVEAVGKHLELEFSGGVFITSHLRMNGRWIVSGPDEVPRGRPWLMLRTPRGVACQWNGPVLRLGRIERRRLGSDLLADEVDIDELVTRLRLAEPGRPLGEVLQSQALVAGIGNLWASEALWHAGIAPGLAIDAATDDELRAAVAWARTAMGRAVVESRPPLAVYRRVGRKCTRCGTAIVSRGIGESNRTAYWCPGCQRDA